jgi:general secretion pathway protein N
MVKRSIPYAAFRPSGQAVPTPWRWVRWAAGLGTLIAVVVFAPAAWLARGVLAASDGQVLLARAQGSVWQGSAELYLTGGYQAQDAARLPERVHWRLLPAWPHGQPGAKIRLQLPCCAQQDVELTVHAGWKQVAADVLIGPLQLPAQWLSGLGAPWNTLDPQGRLQLSGEGFRVLWRPSRLRFEGKIQLDLLAMSSRLSTLRTLGDYRLTVRGGEAPAIDLQTLKGALQLSGTGSVVGSRIRFKGEASASPEQLEALSNVLNIIGRRVGNKSLISLG